MCYSDPVSTSDMDEEVIMDVTKPESPTTFSARADIINALLFLTGGAWLGPARDADLPPYDC